MKNRDKMREIVERGYDEGDYMGHFHLREALDDRETRFFTELEKHVPVNGKILDLGSGTGIPYDKYLVGKGFRVTGLDISEKHVNRARENVPEATYIKADFSRYNLGTETYDAIISLYSIFHIPREEHEPLLKNIYNALKPVGVFLATLGVEDMEMDVNEFIGSTMAWSSYSMNENIELVIKTGFKPLLMEEEDEEGENHLWILAKKTN